MHNIIINITDNEWINVIILLSYKAASVLCWCHFWPNCSSSRYLTSQLFLWGLTWNRVYPLGGKWSLVMGLFLSLIFEISYQFYRFPTQPKPNTANFSTNLTYLVFSKYLKIYSDNRIFYSCQNPIQLISFL